MKELAGIEVTEAIESALSPGSDIRYVRLKEPA